MRIHNKASIRLWHWTARALWRSTTLTALLLVSLVPLAAQNEPESVAAAPAEQADEVAAPGYSGPAVLSRANQPSIGQGSVFATLQPFISVNEFFDNGTNTGFSGGTPDSSSSGVALSFGLTGTRRWKGATVSLQYEGNYQRSSQQSTIVGTNQFLNLTAVVPFQHHFMFSYRQTAGTSKQGFGSLSFQPESLEMSTPVPANEPLNSEVKFVDSMATIVYQKSNRLSFSASLDESLIRQQYLSLVGTDSASVRGDVNYQLTPRTTVGLDYTFNHYGYTTFGSAAIQIVSLDYSWRMTRTVDVAGQLGTAYGSVQSLSSVPIDPELAPILGTSMGLQVTNRIIKAPSYNVRVIKHWYHASADLDYQKGVSPGNGLVLTSTTETIMGGFSYTVRNSWTVSIEGGWTTLNAISAATSKYSSYVANVSLSHAIRPGLETIARFEARPFTYVGPTALNQTTYIAGIGLTFSPKPLPVVLR